MKIEVGESLACSYLRHVKRCWIVQANWKASEALGIARDAELEERFFEMKRRFDPDGSVFKKTKDAAQFLKQAEIDVVGVDQQGDVHAMEVAFHEAGLNYSGKDDRVLKKMLRTHFILRTLITRTRRLCIYFLSPRVHPAGQRLLETMFADLRRAYADVEWCLLTNHDFAEFIIKPTLDKARGVADLSELFVRSVKLLETARYTVAPSAPAAPTPPHAPGPEVGVQCLVRALMRTLLVDCPSSLNKAEIDRLMDEAYCKTKGFKIGNRGLIRRKDLGRKDLGREIKGHARYWADAYDDYYVCSEWGKRYHCDNARSLQAFVNDLILRKPMHEDILRPHFDAFRDYLAGNCPSPAP